VKSQLPEGKENSQKVCVLQTIITRRGPIYCYIIYHISEDVILDNYSFDHHRNESTHLQNTTVNLKQ